MMDVLHEKQNTFVTNIANILTAETIVSRKTDVTCIMHHIAIFPAKVRLVMNKQSEEKRVLQYRNGNPVVEVVDSK